MIKFENVSFSYENHKIINNFSKTFRKGKFYVLKGESGSGKSTLLKLAYGLLIPQSGSIVRNYSSSSFIFDKDNLFNTSVFNNLKCVSKDINKINEFLDYFKMKDLKNKNINELSNGQKRRIAIIRCLLIDADVYFIDEAIRGLDEENIILVLNKFKEIFKNKTVLYVTHNLNEIEDYDYEIVEI